MVRRGKERLRKIKVILIPPPPLYVYSAAYAVKWVGEWICWRPREEEESWAVMLDPHLTSSCMGGGGFVWASLTLMTQIVTICAFITPMVL